ncbi:DinB family protein [Adhaeribacter arboris]|uniref:DinB family protein n=2 Tax=Adhaeribacter arboris TaxID=2072846 RepID=A0A2T2YA36_9BACT|nr:DinB family protein [Adhaeribacter arboris]
MSSKGIHLAKGWLKLKKVLKLILTSMKTILKIFLSVLAFNLLTFSASAQQIAPWSEADRKYLLDNLARSRDLLVKETTNLTPEQWKFKESPDRWSINEVVEHIALWELLFDREVSQALAAGPQPELAKAAKPDSVILSFIREEKPHVTTEYTKPFTFSVPTGLYEGKDNVAAFLKRRNESMAYLKTALEDLRQYFLKPGRPNIHQVYINVFGHTDRHLRQIRKIKQHLNYPKSKLVRR